MEFTLLDKVYVLIGIGGFLAILFFLWLFTALIVIAEYQRHDSIR